jgi:carbon starvation protein
MTLMRRLLWIGVALFSAAAIGVIALRRGEPINALWLVTAALCTYAIGFRFYSKFIAAKGPFTR